MEIFLISKKLHSDIMGFQLRETVGKGGCTQGWVQTETAVHTL